MVAKRKHRRWPPWWEWELEVTDHVHKRMARRGFAEIDLPRMMEHVKSYRRDIAEGRWVIETQHQERPWEVIVEPIPERQILVVVTAYDIWD